MPHLAEKNSFLQDFLQFIFENTIKAVKYTRKTVKTCHFTGKTIIYGLFFYSVEETRPKDSKQKKPKAEETLAYSNTETMSNTQLHLSSFHVLNSFIKPSNKDNNNTNSLKK